MSTHATELPDLARSDQVRRYVLAELKDDELREFEQLLLASAELQDQVEAEFLLRDGARGLSEVAAPVIERAHAQPDRRPIFQIAAALVVGLAGGILMSPNGAELQPTAGPASWVSFVNMRGDSSSNVRTVEPHKAIAARFLTAGDDLHSLRVMDKDNSVLVALASLQPDADGQLLVVLPPFEAAQAPLTLELQSESGIERYQLELR